MSSHRSDLLEQKQQYNSVPRHLVSTVNSVCNWIEACGYILGFAEKQFSFWPRAAELTSCHFLKKKQFSSGDLRTVFTNS